MTEVILSLVPVYGLIFLALILFVSRLGIPLPSSLLMLTSGSFVGGGELVLLPTLVTAFLATILGDQLGYLIGIKGGAQLRRWLAGSKERTALLQKASDWIDKRGGVGVFLSRWLVSPLGPYVNYIGGVAGLGWHRFSAWAAAGGAVWVSIYIGLGVVFSDNITMVAVFAGSISGFLAAGLVALLLGWWLFVTFRKSSRD